MANGNRAALREQGGATRDAAVHHRHIHSTKAQLVGQQPRHGRIVGDVWHKKVIASKHMLRVPRAWAVDLADLDAAERYGCKLLCIKDMEQLQDYWAAISLVCRRGFVLDRGHSAQWALTIEHWRTSKEEAEVLAQRLEEPQPAAVQLGLFEAGR